MNTVDVGAILDEGQWSGYQKFLVFVTALAIVLDGLDNQVLGSAIPALMREWSVPRPAFVPVQTSGMVGMMVGGFIGGYLGDRMGRRVALIGSVMAFGVLTVLVSLSTGLVVAWHPRGSRGARPWRRDAQCRRAVVRIRSAPAAALRGDAHHRVHSTGRVAGRVRWRPDPADIRLACALPGRAASFRSCWRRFC